MLTQLRYFVTIVDHGNMTAASVALGVSQPALSRSLKALEQQMAVRLIDRETGGMTPTPAGALLLGRARVLLAEQKSLAQDMRAFIDGERSITRINGAPMTAVALLPAILSRMATERPHCRVSVHGDCGANYAWKRAALLAGEIDVILTLHDPALHIEGLVQELLFEPVSRVLVASGHPMAGNPAIELDELTGYRWILPPRGSSPRGVVENEFRVRGLSLPRDTIEISDWRITLNLVGSSNHVAVVPYHPACFGDMLNHFHILPITFRVRPLAISLVTRAPGMMREGTRAVVETARTIVGAFSI